MSENSLCVRNTFLDTRLNTDGSQRIVIHRCTSAPAVPLSADLNGQRDGGNHLNSGQLGFLLAHVVAMRGEEERTRQALCKMQDLNSSLDEQVSVTRQRCFVTTIILGLIRNDGSVRLHRTWRTFYSCYASHSRISITQLMFRIYGALVVSNLRRLDVLCKRMDDSVPLCVHDIQTILDALAFQAPMQILILERRTRYQRLRLLTPGLPIVSRHLGRGGDLLPLLWSVHPMVLLHPGHDASYVPVCNLFG